MSRIDDTAQKGQGGQGDQSAGVNQIKETAGQVGQQLRDMGTQAKSVAQEQMGQIREQATQYYDQSRDMAQQYYEEGRQRAMEWEQGLEDYVRQQPVKAVLMAAGVGLVLGFLWRRS